VALLLLTSTVILRDRRPDLIKIMSGERQMAHL